MQSQNTIDAALHQLERLYWLDSLCSQLCEVHRRLNQPDAPASEIARTPRTLPFLKPGKLEQLGHYEQLALDAYNNGVKAAFLCVGWEHIALFTAIANETRGTSEWNAYYQEALATVQAFFQSGQGWEEFEAYVLEPAQNYLASQGQEQRFHIASKA